MGIEAHRGSKVVVLEDLGLQRLRDRVDLIRDPLRAVGRLADAHRLGLAHLAGQQFAHLAGLFDVAVREDQRGKGYARSIVRAALRWAAAQGAQRAWLQVMVANKSAVDLYTRLGFQEAYSYSYRQKGE